MDISLWMYTANKCIIVTAIVIIATINTAPHDATSVAAVSVIVAAACTALESSPAACSCSNK